MCSSSGIVPRPALRRSLFFVVRAVKPTQAPPSRSESGGFPLCLVRCCTSRSRDRGGAAGTRTPDLRRARAALSQLSYGPLMHPRSSPRPGSPRVGAPGFEPGTSALSGPRSNQLSYAPAPAPRPRPPRPLKRSWPASPGAAVMHTRHDFDRELASPGVVRCRRRSRIPTPAGVFR